jgi:pimeloyl-ACP methyl ester carboxylesterase
MDLSHIILLVATILMVWIGVTAVFAVVVGRRNPPIGRLLECNGVRLHYLDRGNRDNATLILLHGNGMFIQDFLISGVMDDAADRYRVLCFDRPGFGHSARPRSKIWTPEAQAELLVTASRRLGVERAVVVGHSWGTLVAIAMGFRFPDFVQGLVLASGYYFPTWRKDVWLLSGPAIPVVGDLMRYTISPLIAWAILSKLLRKLFAPRPLPDGFWREFPLMLSVRPLHLRAGAEESALMIPAAARMQQHYSELACPVALIVGNEDKIVERQQTLRLQSVVSRSIVRPVPNAGHMVHHAAPAELIDAAALMSVWPKVARK